MESAAGSSALDSLSCFVHGDATDLEADSIANWVADLVADLEPVLLDTK
jgi:hypothetical protein